MAGRVERGEVRLYRFASPDKQRPVLVLTRTAAIQYLNKVTVAPITSTIRGVPSEVVLDEQDGMKQRCAVNLYSLVTVSKSGLGAHLAQLNKSRIREICSAIAFSLGCES